MAGAMGAPIFAILGGAAALLFLSDGITPATILVETYSLSVSPTLPTGLSFDTTDGEISGNIFFN